MEFNDLLESIITDPITARYAETGFKRYSKANAKISKLTNKLDRAETKATGTQHNLAIGNVGLPNINKPKTPNIKHPKLPKIHPRNDYHKDEPKDSPKPILPRNDRSHVHDHSHPLTASTFFKKHLSKLKSTFKGTKGVY